MPRPINAEDIGESTIDDFFYWINERHSIYQKKERGDRRPWTKDPILNYYKFTNVFRELDRGTVALRQNILKPGGVKEKKLRDDPRLIVFNTWWYRLFNLADHAYELGGVDSRDKVVRHIRKKDDNGEKVFTSAHMISGIAGERKVDSYCSAIPEVDSDEIREILSLIEKYGTMQEVWKFLRQQPMIGKFVAYEITCDLAWEFYLTDVYEWANIGPGCARGLERLGLDCDLDELRSLWVAAKDRLASHVKPHHPRVVGGEEYCQHPPFQLREIEHSLCEFDKYERIRRHPESTRLKVYQPYDE